MKAPGVGYSTIRMASHPGPLPSPMMTPVQYPAWRMVAPTRSGTGDLAPVLLALAYLRI